jgi:Rrf2 family nitric oxide-sensitive transcriptional repressor
MQLNAFTDYSLRVLMYAAAHPEGRCATGDVAAAFGISRHHAVKIVHALQKLGYLETVRGRRGGFRLARAPERIRIGDVIRRTEGTLALVECFDNTSACPLTPACGLRHALTEASAAFFDVLDRRTLADALARPRWTTQIRTVAAAGGQQLRTLT